MKPNSFIKTIALILTITFIAPSAFLAAPRTANAVGVPTDDFITQIKSTLTAIQTFTIDVATQAQYYNTYVLQPLAFVLSGNLMKALTAGVLGFVTGKANGTGVPQFVVDVQKSMQTVSDSRALAYLKQFGTNSNSPFASSISSALRNDYLSKTSLTGFWAANMNTLAQSTPSYGPGFLEGNWSQGGVVAWFALTTQTQNNPYTLYQNSQAQMSTLIGLGAGGVTGARAQTLSWGQGFMSWCGSTDNPTTIDNSETSTDESNPAYSSSSTGVNPGDPCMNDGIPGEIKTPGSTIKATLDKVLGGQQDQFLRMGNIGTQINQIMGNIATVMQTAQFASQILGGSGSGGLFGVNAPSGSNSTSRLMQYEATPSLGVTNSDVYKGAATLPSSGSDMLSKITRYQTAWNTITSATNAASTIVADLANACDADTSSRAAQIQATAAREVITTQIAPVLARATAASLVIASSTAFAQKVQAELKSGVDSVGGAYTADIQTLQTMPPTGQDVASIEQEAQSMGGSTAIPAGSLTVSGGSIIDKMSLLSTNAAALKISVCTPVGVSSPSDSSNDAPSRD